jgi:hypothetical protein
VNDREDRFAWDIWSGLVALAILGGPIGLTFIGTRPVAVAIFLEAFFIGEAILAAVWQLVMVLRWLVTTQG